MSAPMAGTDVLSVPISVKSMRALLLLMNLEAVIINYVLYDP